MNDRVAQLNYIIRTCITARDATCDTVFLDAVDALDDLVTDLRLHSEALRAAARDSQRLVASLAAEVAS